MNDRVLRIRTEAVAEAQSFLRQRTAVFFTFFFPLLIVGLFGFVIQSGSSGGLFALPQAYYVPGYLAVVVVLTPLSRVGSSITRYRISRRFEKLATTPLTKAEWLAAHTLVNVGFIGLASMGLISILELSGRASFRVTPLLVVFLVLGIALFCAIGALLGLVADSRDGVVAASNGIGIPMVFLADTFVPADKLPAAVAPLINILPLTYFARGVRALTYSNTSPLPELGVLTVLTVGAFVLATRVLPWAE